MVNTYVQSKAELKSSKRRAVVKPESSAKIMSLQTLGTAVLIYSFNSTVLNKLQSYSRISALGPEGHCTSRFKSDVQFHVFHVDRMWTSTRGGGSGSCGRMWTEGGQKLVFADVVDGWPLNTTTLYTQQTSAVMSFVNGNLMKSTKFCSCNNIMQEFSTWTLLRRIVKKAKFQGELR